MPHFASKEWRGSGRFERLWRIGLGRFSRTTRAVLFIATALVLLTVPVLATETWREYDSWENRPLGILDFLYGVKHHDLPPMPDWNCDKSQPPRLVGGELTVRLVMIGTASNPYSDLQWQTLLSERLGVPVRLVYGDLLGSYDTAHKVALEHRDTVHLALRDGYFRGEDLNEKIEGVACTNLALINSEAACQEGVAAHEIGHVLGLSHSSQGLMRARAASCPATLDSAETLYLLAHSRPGSSLIG